VRRRHVGGNDLFPELIAAELRAIELRRMSYERRRRARLEAAQRKLIAEREAWASCHFATRIDAMIDSLSGMGDTAQGMLAALVAGTVADVRAGRLSEEVMSFREAKAAEMLAKLNVAPGVQIAYAGFDLDGLIATEPDVACLPKELLHRLSQVIGAMGEQLAGLGFRSERDVRSDCPPAARALAARMNQCIGAVILLGISRRQAANPHKRWNPEKLIRAEVWASELLGVDTKIFQPDIV
jgi:hypothetical protein